MSVLYAGAVGAAIYIAIRLIPSLYNVDIRSSPDSSPDSAPAYPGNRN